MQKRCTICQTPIREDAAFCPACGAKAMAADPAPAVQATPQRSVLPFVIIAIVFAILLAAAAVYYFTHKPEEAAPAETPGAVRSEEKAAPVRVELATPTPSPVLRNTEAVIESIRTRYYAAQDEMHTYKTETNGNLTKYYAPTGTLARVDTPNANGGGDSYYYDNGSLYFVFSYYGTTEHRFYFENGRLVRWIYTPAPAEAVYESAEAHPDFALWESRLLTQSETHSAAVRYRVRKTADDAAGQIGAYAEFENAKNTADANPGYAVYDMYGTLIYAP